MTHERRFFYAAIVTVVLFLAFLGWAVGLDAVITSITLLTDPYTLAVLFADALMVAL